MSDRSFDVVVVGAGPAGLAAACRAAESGARVAMVDDNPQPGGQIWRNKAGAECQRWCQLAERHGVEWVSGARVFAMPAPGRIALELPDAETELEYRGLILATGARELFLPFPGWTLPNVMGAGGLQALAKSGLPIAGKKVVIAGSGPLLLAVAKYMRDHGADLRAIAEQADRSALLRFGLGLLSQPGKLMQAAGFAASLAGVKHLTSCWPVSAQGEGKLESVTLRRGDKTFTIACDYLACGFGLIPNLELAAHMGCAMNETGVRVDEFQQTSVAGIYAAGEATGIGGVELSVVEGEIAGYAAAGKQDRAGAQFAAREKHRAFARALAKTFALRDELKQMASEETLVCRCEDVTLRRARQFRGWREAKLHTRCGMGPCQGRVCGGAVEFLLGWKSESVRPPVFPARIESLTRAGLHES
jgi:NADPH-dependent 2,4-dienoyl-CoA reductase/sulfur reductase-like enzyme